jgi:hypothetical protein
LLWIASISIGFTALISCADVLTGLTSSAQEHWHVYLGTVQRNRLVLRDYVVTD